MAFRPMFRRNMEGDMDSAEMWLGIWRRRRQFVAGDAMELARLLFYDPESEAEATYLLGKHSRATIEATHDWRGDHLLVNGKEMTFGITIAEWEAATENEAQ